MIKTVNIDSKLKITNDNIAKYINEPVILTISGDIARGSYLQTVDAINKALENEQPFLPIIIDSYGGSVYELLGMLDVLKQSRLPLITTCYTKAMSAGAYLFACGTERVMSKNASVLIHEASGNGWYDIKTTDVSAKAKELQRLDAILLTDMAQNCHKPSDYFIKLIKDANNADITYNAQECLDHGIATKVGEVSYDFNINVSHKLKINGKEWC